MPWVYSLLTLLFLFLPSATQADETERRIHLIYAGDQSASMRFSHKPSWISAQQYFLTEYFSNYSSRCQELHIDYVGWGKIALPPLQMVLRTNADGKEFSDLVNLLSYQNLGATVQHIGMIQALSLVESGYDRTIIIFVSDEFVGSQYDAELWRLVPDNVELVGISLGSDGVAGYFDRHIVPKTPNGKHYHADTTRQFGEILYSILDGLGFDHCLAS